MPAYREYFVLKRAQMWPCVFSFIYLCGFSFFLRMQTVAYLDCFNS